MGYLFQHKREFFISCGVFATFIVVIFWAIWSVVHNTFDIKNLLSIIAVIFEYFGWYFNMPTSEENCRHTGLMRLEKTMKKNGTDGENFFDDIQENSRGENSEKQSEEE